MLAAYCGIREELEQPKFLRERRQVVGRLAVSAANLAALQTLQDGGHIATMLKHGNSISYLPDIVDNEIQITLVPASLNYFEDLSDLFNFTLEEPSRYYVRGFNFIEAQDPDPADEIKAYRDVLAARALLRETADLQTESQAVFLAPEKLEIAFLCEGSDLRRLPELPWLRAQLAPDTVERDQRLVLFKRSLREHLRAHPVELHFKLFLLNFTSICDTFNRDYQLWIGSTFGELEKSFEEKRIKFISDLNSILGSVQASILAVPIAAILLGDKYDLANPLKNFLLALAVSGLGCFSLKLLTNQDNTLAATRKAIDSAKSDFEKKQPKRKEEFKSRLDAIDSQEHRVKALLGWMRTGIKVILTLSGTAWLVSFLLWAMPGYFAHQPVKGGVGIAITVAPTPAPIPSASPTPTKRPPPPTSPTPHP